MLPQLGEVCSSVFCLLAALWPQSGRAVLDLTPDPTHTLPLCLVFDLDLPGRSVPCRWGRAVDCRCGPPAPRCAALTADGRPSFYLRDERAGGTFNTALPLPLP